MKYVQNLLHTKAYFTGKRLLLGPYSRMRKGIPLNLALSSSAVSPVGKEIQQKSGLQGHRLKRLQPGNEVETEERKL